jgi:hypothetical protein
MTSIMPNVSKHPKLLNICYDNSSNDISPKDNWSTIMTSLVPNISNTFNTIGTLKICYDSLADDISPKDNWSKDRNVKLL